ncbi:hypothetical protein J2W27_004011 [Variovorax boronicumulans]|uniref:hypothetical protein n=1 Tax=Variovorax boronicumulans TaxID=436515 RepID=UPI00278A1C07|nr:hypothetical protein [Variovorax boronicumulans]MDP9911887.1 hypothetical protein [Variovorax boronicumulans]
MVANSPPFYLDWQFWSAVAAIAAIILSQLPPIHLLLRPRRLEVEVHTSVNVTHKVGHPNIQFYASLRNTGGRALRIRSMRILLERDSIRVDEYPAQSYFETPSALTSVLWMPFTIKPGDEWGHSVIYLHNFHREQEKQFRQSIAALRTNLTEKYKAQTAADKGAHTEPLSADAEHVQPFIDMFNQRFIWTPGDYQITLTVETDASSASVVKKYRFTLFESDTEELRKHLQDYPFGIGLLANAEQHAGIHIAFIPL